MAITSSRTRTTKKKTDKKTTAKKPVKATVTARLSNDKAPKGVKQKNVVKVEQLKNKSTLTTLSGGRTIQQVAGRTAYVTNRGNGPARTRPKKVKKKG